MGYSEKFYNQSRALLERKFGRPHLIVDALPKHCALFNSDVFERRICLLTDDQSSSFRSPLNPQNHRCTNVFYASNCFISTVQEQAVFPAAILKEPLFLVEV